MLKKSPQAISWINAPDKKGKARENRKNIRENAFASLFSFFLLRFSDSINYNSSLSNHEDFEVLQAFAKLED